MTQPVNEIPPRLVPLKDRGVISVKGPDAHRFLQALLAQDLTKLFREKALYSLFLTATGRVFADFFVLQAEKGLWIECEKARLQGLMKALQLYCLRQDVVLEDISHTHYVFSLFGSKSLGGALKLLPLEGSCRFESDANGDESAAFVDPRLARLGVRLIATQKTTFPLRQWPQGALDDYRVMCFELGVAEGASLKPQKAMPLEYGLHKLNGLSDKKGCYLGQELIARTLHRGVIRKHVFPALCQGPTPDKETAVTLNGKTVGEVIDTHKTIALLRLSIAEALEAYHAKVPMMAASTKLSPYPVSWMGLEN